MAEQTMMCIIPLDIVSDMWLEIYQVLTRRQHLFPLTIGGQSVSQEQNTAVELEAVGPALSWYQHITRTPRRFGIL